MQDIWTELKYVTTGIYYMHGMLSKERAFWYGTQWLMDLYYCTVKE